MLKILNTLLISLCVATVLSELVGIGLLWQRGQLTSQTLQDIRLVLRGEIHEIEKEPEDIDAPQMSLEDLIRARAEIEANFDSRQRELNKFELMIREKADQITGSQKSLEEVRQRFLTELDELKKKNEDASTEQARGILMALPPDEAARTLMQVTLEEDLVLMKGMPEKVIANILQEMVETNAAKRRQEIFQRLSTGGLVDDLVEGTAQELKPAEAKAPSGN